MLWTGYPPCGVLNGPIELGTVGYPPGGSSYGRDSRRSESTLSLSSLAPHILSIFSNMASILHDMDLSYLSYLIYRTGGVPYGVDTFQGDGGGAKWPYRIGNRTIPYRVEYFTDWIPAGRCTKWT